LEISKPRGEGKSLGLAVVPGRNSNPGSISSFFTRSNVVTIWIHLKRPEVPGTRRR